MPQATYVHEGESVDYTPSAAIAAGDVVVQGDLVGVAPRALAAGEAGAVVVWGVFDLAKATNVSFAVGAVVYWDDTNNVVTATATGNKQIGKTIRAAASADTTVRVRLSQ
jgi:predicted RecA/RadA family phage recombinase